MVEIVLNDVHKYYGTHHVLRGVSFEIFENWVGLTGKTAANNLFKIISGQEPYDKEDLILPEAGASEFLTKSLYPLRPP